MRRSLLVLAALVSLGADRLAAQDSAFITSTLAQRIAVRTFALRHLKPEDAAKLVGPYVTSNDGGVFDAGSIRAITVRETAGTLAKIDSLLKIHDRERQALTLRFQLIAAMDTGGSRSPDPAISAIDSSLRGLFRFRSYALLGEGTTNTEERSDFALTIGAGTQQYGITGWIDQVNAGSTPATANIRLTLSDNGQLGAVMRPGKGEDLFTTGLTVPLGQSVVLGSAASTMSSRTLILVVRPEASSLGRR